LNWMFRRQASENKKPGFRRDLVLLRLSSERTFCVARFTQTLRPLARSQGETERVLARLIQLSKNRPPVRQAGIGTIGNSTIEPRDVKDHSRHRLIPIRRA
jgi:hypothetical protein